MSATRSRKIAARLWWMLLPYAGETGYPNPDNPTRWRAYPLTWAWKLVGKLPSSAPFEPLPPIVCNCDECRAARRCRVTVLAVVLMAAIVVLMARIRAKGIGA